MNFRRVNFTREYYTVPREGRIFSLLLVSAFCLIFVGCGRIYGPTEEVKAFADEKEEVVVQIGKKLDANPTEAGIDEARKILAGKKDSLKAKKQARS